ncbi:MAG TPA: neutral zinc metallopeptidase [Actinomycetota bacterium]|nr:neutral zinc metallopeptidase [Actinomycetota bacterium]
MKWRKRRTSADIEDRRGRSGAMGGLPVGGAIGIPGLIVLALVFFLTRGGGGGGAGDIGNALDQINSGAQANATPLNGPDPDARLVSFMSYVLDDVQKFWTKTFADSGQTYTDAKLVLFTASTSSGCGGATSAIGPHYCPADGKVYLDLGFFRELRDRFGAPGDFAQAYVLAHEIGHHVQDLLGISDKVDQQMQGNGGGEGATGLSVRLELQADCLAGVWAHSAYERHTLSSGDLEEGLRAAAAVGDDRIQKQATGRVDRETWTHGSSAERVRWFRAGFDSGQTSNCDTFGASSL